MVKYYEVLLKVRCYFKWGGVDIRESHTQDEKVSLETSWEANISEKDEWLQDPKLVMSLI